MNSPQKEPRQTGWNSYIPWLLVLSSTFVIVALIFVGISWIPLEQPDGVPPSAYDGPYVPGGLTILFAVIAIRQLILRHRNLHRPVGVSSALDEEGGHEAGSEVALMDDTRAVSAPEPGPRLSPRARVAVIAGGLGFALLLGVFLGLANGYSHEVVDQTATAPTSHLELAGTYSLVDLESQLCEPGDDYYAWSEMHRTMYNALCIGHPLNAIAKTTCDALGDFVDDTQDRYAGCGYGCTTAGTGDWGWSLHTLEADTVSVQTPGLRQIVHVETCVFNLGPIKFGSCLGPGA